MIEESATPVEGAGGLSVEQWKTKAIAHGKAALALRDKAQELRDKAQVAIATSKELKICLRLSKKQNAELKQRVETLKSEQVAIETRYRESVRSGKLLKIEVATLKQEAELYGSALKECKAQLATARLQSDRAQQEAEQLTTLRRELQESKREVGRIHRTKNELADLLEREQKALKSLRNSEYILQQEKLSVLRELEESVASEEALRSKVESLKEQLAAVAHGRTKALEQLGLSEACGERLEAELDESKSVVERQARDLQKKQNTILVLTSETQRYSVELDRLQDELSELRESQAGTKRANVEAVAVQDHLRKEVLKLTQRCRKSDERVEYLERELKKVRAEAAELFQENKDIFRELREAKSVGHRRSALNPTVELPVLDHRNRTSARAEQLESAPADEDEEKRKMREAFVTLWELTTADMT